MRIEVLKAFFNINKSKQYMYHTKKGKHTRGLGAIATALTMTEVYINYMI